MNMNEIREFLGNDEEFIARLMDKFVQESALDIEKLRGASAVANWEMARAVAHKMLSSTRIFGMAELNTPLEEIETLVNNRSGIDRIPGLVEKVHANWKKAIAEVKEMRGKIKA